MLAQSLFLVTAILASVASSTTIATPTIPDPQTPEYKNILPLPTELPNSPHRVSAPLMRGGSPQEDTDLSGASNARVLTPSPSPTQAQPKLEYEYITEIVTECDCESSSAHIPLSSHGLVAGMSSSGVPVRNSATASAMPVGRVASASRGLFGTSASAVPVPSGVDAVESGRPQ
ncbi:hypothetical protein BBP40_008540, partial [Aspergillus hancockii]